MLYNDPARFTEDALRGFVDAHSATVRQVPGGVVRRRPTPTGKVAVLVGGGSGHYPAFCGLVGEGFADGAVVGNVFTSPSADDAASVARHVQRGAGVIFLTGNYAGDVMNFTLACRRLAAEGVDARYVVVTDDIASAPVGQEEERRGIAGDLTVFKVAAAAAERGDDLDAVERLARHANDRTRTLGVAFDGCTLPGSDSSLFSVPDGLMGIGVGIHGEPGIGEVEMPSAHELGGLLAERVLAEAPENSDGRVAAVLNGLGRTKYEELFVVWATVSDRLRKVGLTVVEPDVGELVTSLDMAGCSLTLMWLDSELEPLWRAPAAAPAYRKGAPRTRSDTLRDETLPTVSARVTPAEEAVTDVAAGPIDQRKAEQVLAAIDAAVRELVRNEEELGRLDAVAGDGDHGRGMVRGVTAAHRAADEAVASGCGASRVLIEAGKAWAGQAGGTSGILWGAMLEEAGRTLPDDDPQWDRWEATAVQSLADAVGAAVAAVREVGKADPGDKTMLDALVPFHEALLSDTSGVPEVAWARAADAAHAAAHRTAELRPRRGRARPLAERSLGHPDPGAISLAGILVQIASMTTREESGQ